MLKGLGLSGTPVHGKMFVDRMKEMAHAEFLDTLGGLIDMGFVLTSKVNVMKIEEAERSSFRVNPQYARDLKDAMRPQGRREERERRRRRG
jgi:hypothetical protein